jgi:hypothetical protein
VSEEELAEVEANYAARYGGRVRTHCDVCWTWADHAECTVPRLVAEVRRLSAELGAVRDALGAAFVTPVEGGETRSWAETTTPVDMARLLVAHHGSLAARNQAAYERRHGSADG